MLAYAEYVVEPEYEDGVSLVERHRNVVVTRTLSKIHGLAALRVGWAYCPEAVASVLNRVRGPFNCSAPGQAAATAAVRDLAHVQISVDMNTRNRTVLSGGLRNLGLERTAFRGKLRVGTVRKSESGREGRRGASGGRNSGSRHGRLRVAR